MRVFIVLILLLCVSGALGWRQCGRPSDRVVKVSGLEVASTPKGVEHWIRVTVRGTSSTAIAADATVHTTVRMGAIQLHLEPVAITTALGPGPIEYVYEGLFDAPSDMTVDAKFSVTDGGREVLCVRDIEIDL